MHNHPLAEVFGFPPDNLSRLADHYRKHRLCPYNNKVPSCTKDKASDPLGVCTIWDGEDLAITCPIRFRQEWLIASDAAEFFFPEGSNWTSLTEVRLNDANGKSAGNIDVVLVAYNEQGRIIDFGALEVQGVYISGNVRDPFTEYQKDPANHYAMDWRGHTGYPRADYLSSSRKRLAPQLIYKGGILHSWGKKMAVALHSGFFDTLPVLPEASPSKAEIAWLIYDLERDQAGNRFNLTHSRTVYTQFESSLETITTPLPGPMDEFINVLQSKLDEKLENPPDAPTLSDVIRE